MGGVSALVTHAPFLHRRGGQATPHRAGHAPLGAGASTLPPLATGFLFVIPSDLGCYGGRGQGHMMGNLEVLLFAFYSEAFARATHASLATVGLADGHCAQPLKPQCLVWRLPPASC